MVFGKIFKKKRPENEAVIDLGKLKELRNTERVLKDSTETTGTETNVGFLGTLAGAASSDEKPLRIASSSSVDVEKFKRLGKRIDNLMDRLELLERKIERIEHRVDLRY